MRTATARFGARIARGGCGRRMYVAIAGGEGHRRHRCGCAVEARRDWGVGRGRADGAWLKSSRYMRMDDVARGPWEVYLERIFKELFKNTFLKDFLDISKPFFCCGKYYSTTLFTNIKCFWQANCLILVRLVECPPTVR
jgi:hypothetical protein